MGLQSLPYQRIFSNGRDGSPILRVWLRQFLQVPPLSIFPFDEFVRLGSIRALEQGGVPLNLLADAIGDVAEVVRLRQPAGVLEVAGGRLAGFAGVDPLGMMPLRRWNKRLGAFEVFELVFGEQQMLAVIGEEHSLVADEE